MVVISRYNVLDYLSTEEDIAAYLDGALEEGGPKFFFLCLADATKARIINQVAKETGIDRKILCEMFLEDADIEVPEVSQEVICKYPDFDT